MYLTSLNPYNFRHKEEDPKIIGFELFTPENLPPRPCFKVEYGSDKKIDYVAHSEVVNGNWEIIWHTPKWVEHEGLKITPPKKDPKECSHENVTRWNHGYHSLCKDCGEEDV